MTKVSDTIDDLIGETVERRTKEGIRRAERSNDEERTRCGRRVPASHCTSSKLSIQWRDEWEDYTASEQRERIPPKRGRDVVEGSQRAIVLRVNSVYNGGTSERITSRVNSVCDPAIEPGGPTANGRRWGSGRGGEKG